MGMGDGGWGMGDGEEEEQGKYGKKVLIIDQFPIPNPQSPIFRYLKNRTL
jgi:hypothetical protein